MKKFLSVIGTIIAMILIVVICLGAYNYVIDIEDRQNEVEEELTASMDTEPIFSLEEYPKVDASLATQPLADAFIENFTGTLPSDEELDYTNTHPGYIRLINGEVDLLVVTEPSEEELELAKEAGVELEVIPVVKEGFVFYVNEKNPVKSLTLSQIQDIYAGEITNWKDVGGNDEKIIAYQRPENSGSQTGMYSLVMKDRKIMTAPKEDLIETMYEIVNLVSDYDNGVNSIGYSYYYYATTMFEDMDKDVTERIRLLAVDGVEPNYDTIKDDTYPLETAYYIVINKNEEEGSNVRKLVDAMLSSRGQAVAKEVGYVPVK
jgi:phosphate transport system substrate-binding protein